MRKHASRAAAARLTAIVVAMLMLTLAEPALAAVSVSRAEVSGTRLRIEGTAIANRAITVDGNVMGQSDGSGRFQIQRDPFTPPADCTVDVNDGSATPRVATLSGCTVTAPPPPASTGPPAPAPIAPANAASVTVPVTLSWTAVSDPSGIAGYNWEISSSPTFSPLVTRSSTNGTTTQASVGGLSSGTYYWRVQAASNAFVQGAWSATRSFTVTGSGAGAIGSPVLDPLAAGTQYHPMESVPIQWSAVPGATSYVVEASRDAAFPAPVDVRFDNIPKTSYALTFHSSLQGNWNVRVYAVDANGIKGIPSNVRTFSVSYDAPVGPPPTLLTPADGATVELPVTLDWTDVDNPQPSGYELQIARSSAFTDIEEHVPQLNNSSRTVLSLTAGTKFWRVRHHEGDASPNTSAVTEWSAGRSFTVATSAPKVVSVNLTRPSGFSGEEIVGDVQLAAAAPAGGAVVDLTSTAPTATPVPASVTVPAGLAVEQFRFKLGQVTDPTPATITGKVGASSASFAVTVNPPTLKGLEPSPNEVTGGSAASAFIALNGSAPAGGAVVSLTSDSPLAVPPASVTVPGGSFSHPITIETRPVQTTTTVTITASWKGKSVPYQLTLTPGVPPDSWTVERPVTTGSEGSSARVAIAAMQTRDVTFNLTSSNPDVARMSPSVTIPAGSPHAGVLIHTTNPAAPTTVTLSVSGAGVTKTATLTVNPIDAAPAPAPAPALGAPTLLSPASGARFAPGQTVAFDWADVSGAASYQIQAGSSSAFSTTVLDRTVTPSQLSTSFAAKGDRFWRVRARDASGSVGAWSLARSFRIN